MSVSAETAFVTSDGFSQSRCGRAAPAPCSRARRCSSPRIRWRRSRLCSSSGTTRPRCRRVRLSARAWARAPAATATRRAEAALAAAAAAAAAPRARCAPRGRPQQCGGGSASGRLRRSTPAAGSCCRSIRRVVHIVTDPLAALLHAPPLFRAQGVRGLPRRGGPWRRRFGQANSVS